MTSDTKKTELLTEQKITRRNGSIKADTRQLGQSMVYASYGSELYNLVAALEML